MDVEGTTVPPSALSQQTSHQQQHQHSIKSVSINQPPLQVMHPNHIKVTTNLNFQYEINDNGQHLGRVDISKALCYQSQEVASNIVANKVLIVHQKKSPILISSPNIESDLQQHYIDCNNNLNPPPIVDQTQQASMNNVNFTSSQQIIAPKNINAQFNPAPFLNHLNRNHPF